jgi:hypothetical protein
MVNLEGYVGDATVAGISRVLTQWTDAGVSFANDS